MAENAPIPWELHEIDAEDGEDWPHHLSIDDADGEEVATIVHRPGPPVPDVKYEQGWRIVRSVNSHADLLAALDDTAATLETMLLEFGHLMQGGDREGRPKVLAAARAAIERNS